MIGLFADEQSGMEARLDVAFAWREALVRRDIEVARALCEDDVELAWTRGIGRGASLIGFFVSSLSSLALTRVFERGSRVVFATPDEAKDGIAAVIVEIRAARIQRISGCLSLQEALERANMTLADEIPFDLSATASTGT